MKEYDKYFEGKIYLDSLMESGISAGEAEYVVNVVSNKIRECKQNTFDHRFTIDNEREIHGMCEEEVALKSGKKIKFTFNYD